MASRDLSERPAGPLDRDPAREERALVIAFALIAAFMVVEVVAALVSHSLALVADAGHMLADAGALLVAVVAGRLAARPAAGVWTYGFKRAEILAAAANGVALAVVALFVCVEGVRRLVHPPAVHGLVVLVVALVGIAVNLAATMVLRGAHRSSLNIEGAFQHVVTDLFAFIATAIAGVVLLATGFNRADAIASLVVAAVMLKAAVGLLRDSGRVLLEGAPPEVGLDEVRAHLLGIDHVTEVHDLHVWTLTSDLPALSAHVVVEQCCFVENHAPRVLDELQACLAGHFDLEHSTFQLEAAGHLDHEAGGHA